MTRTRLTRRGRLVATLGILILILGLLTLPAVLWLRSLGLLKVSDPSGKVTFSIPKGAGTSRIGEILEREEVIDSALGFRIAVYTEGGLGDIQAGKYTLSKGLSAKDALTALEEGPKIPPIVQVTFPEGSWLEEMAETYASATGGSAERFTELATSGEIKSRFQPQGTTTLEGLLFPSTYDVSNKEDEADVVKKLVDEFDERFSDLGAQNASALGVTPYEAAIVASMIEAESRIDSERPKIASVIYNRLAQDIPLGIDATIIYGLGERGRDLTTSDLEQDSPYNTREVLGLPPTPIGAPGEASLEAALNPAQTDLLYYVLVDCEGHHAFSESYEEFLENKAVYESLEC